MWTSSTTMEAESHYCEWNQHVTSKGLDSYQQAISQKSDLTNKIKCSFFQVVVMLILLYGYTTLTLTKHMEKNLINYTRMLWAVLNKSCRQHPTKQFLCGHLPPIMKTIQVRQTRHSEHCWRSKRELISDVLLWNPSHGQTKVWRPARTYIQQLCADTGCKLEDFSEWWTIETGGERGSGKSMLAVQHDDDDDDDDRKELYMLFCYYHHIVLKLISSKYLLFLAIYFWSLIQIFSHTCAVITSCLAAILWWIKYFSLQLSVVYVGRFEPSGILRGTNLKGIDMLREPVMGHHRTVKWISWAKSTICRIPLHDGNGSGMVVTVQRVKSPHTHTHKCIQGVTYPRSSRKKKFRVLGFQSEDRFIFILMKTKHLIHMMVFLVVTSNWDFMPSFTF